MSETRKHRGRGAQDKREDEGVSGICNISETRNRRVQISGKMAECVMKCLTTRFGFVVLAS